MGQFTLSSEHIWSTFPMTISFTTQKRLDWSPNVYNSSANIATSHHRSEFKCWFKFKFCLIFKFCLKFHIKVRIALLNLTSFHSCSNWRQRPLYKSLKFKVYNLHSTFEVHIFILLVFRDGLTALLLVSLGGISTFFFFLLIFTLGGGCRGADGELALASWQGSKPS